MDQLSERMKALITKGSICKIRHLNPRGQTVEHYAIVCNSSPATDTTIVLAVITSVRDDRMLSDVRRQYGEDFICLVPPITFRRLINLSFVNCHKPILRTLEQLCDEVNSGSAVFYHPGTDNYTLISACISGMLNSDRVSNIQKEIIRTCCS